MPTLAGDLPLCYTKRTPPYYPPAATATLARPDEDKPGERCRQVKKYSNLHVWHLLLYRACVMDHWSFLHLERHVRGRQDNLQGTMIPLYGSCFSSSFALHVYPIFLCKAQANGRINRIRAFSSVLRLPDCMSSEVAEVMLVAA